MIAILIRNLIAACVLALFLFIAGLIIWFFIKGSGTAFNDVLFCIGAAPIAIFAVSQIGNFKSRGDHTVQLSRSVSSQSIHDRASQDIRDITSRFASGFCWLLAGIFIWLYLFLFG